MTQQFENRYTIEEYFALEEKAQHRNEYFQGRIYAMAGGTPKHNRISGNIYSELRTQLRKSTCQPFMSDVKVQVKANNLNTYPDVMVVCGDLEYAPNRTDTITNTIFIAEVLSKSTRDYDRTDKFTLYKALPSFQEYLLVDQTKIYIEHWHKTDILWSVRIYQNLADSVTLQSLNLVLPIETIYDEIVF